MTAKPDNAAEDLLGRTLKGKWLVREKVIPKSGATGGFFSVCYIVTDGHQDAFLKALNFKAFFQLFPGKSVVEIINEQTNAFQFEREILLRCKNKRLSKVSTVLDEGEEIVDDHTISNVPFLIFEMAEGDVRQHMNFSKDVELSWKLHSLHDVAIGLNQLHGIDVGHQDLKPSNVLLHETGLVSKIGDLGRSLCSDLEAPHENGNDFTGDFTYAPPEFLYGFNEPNLEMRIRATDMYLFGSLIVFYFTGANMTSLIGKNIDPNFKWDKWRGRFEDVENYLVDGFYKSIKEFGKSISNSQIKTELCTILEYCCYPIPSERGHPKAKAQKGSSYDLQRFITRLDVLEKLANRIIS